MALRRVNFLLRDSKNKTSTLSFPVDGDMTQAELKTWCDSMQPLVSAITDCAVVSATATEDVSVYVDTAEPNSDVEEGARWIYDVIGTNKSRTFRVAGVREALVDSNGRNVKQSEPTIQAFQEAVVSGTGLVPAIPTLDSEARNLTGGVAGAPKSALEEFTKSRRR